MHPSTIFCTTCGTRNAPQTATCANCGTVLRKNTTAPSSIDAQSPAYPTNPLVTDQRLKQRYQVETMLGKGGMGAVYKAHDLTFKRSVAIKEMSQRSLDAGEARLAVEQFEQEALLLAGLKHQSLPSIYDHFGENGRWYLVMDFIEGMTLEKYVEPAEKRVLSIEEALDIGIQLTRVLGYLHTRPKPIIFRDLKPLNIMRTPEGHIYLIDFGIARLFKPGQSKDTASYGTLGYAPPEQWGNTQTTTRTDIYSLGATLHRLLSGHHPQNNQPAFIFKGLRTYNPAVPAALELLIAQMVEMDEQKRPASMEIVKERLTQLQKQVLYPPSIAIPQPSIIPATIYANPTTTPPPPPPYNSYQPTYPPTYPPVYPPAYPLPNPALNYRPALQPPPLLKPKKRELPIPRFFTIISALIIVACFGLLTWAAKVIIDQPPTYSSFNCTDATTTNSSASVSAGCRQVLIDKQKNMKNAEMLIHLPGSLYVSLFITTFLVGFFVLIVSANIATGRYGSILTRRGRARKATKLGLFFTRIISLLLYNFITVCTMALVGMIAGELFKQIPGFTTDFRVFTNLWLSHAWLILLVATLSTFTYTLLAFWLTTLFKNPTSGVIFALVWWILEIAMKYLFTVPGSTLSANTTLKAIPDYFISTNIAALLDNQNHYLTGAALSTTTDQRALLTLSVYLSIFLVSTLLSYHRRALPVIERF